MYTIISLFVDPMKEPVATLLSELMCLGSLDRNEDGDVHFEIWSEVLFKISGFAVAIIYLLLGTYIIYYKSVVKVETMNKITKACLMCLIAFVCSGLIHSVFVIIFTMEI